MLFAVKQRIVNNLLHALDEGVLDEIHRLDTKEKRQRHANIFVRVEDRLNRHYNGIDPLPRHKEHQLLGVRRNIIQDFSGAPGEGFKARRRKRKRDAAKQAEADYRAFSSAYEIPRGGPAVPYGPHPPDTLTAAQAARRQADDKKGQAAFRAKREQERQKSEARRKAHSDRLRNRTGYHEWVREIRGKGPGRPTFVRQEPPTKTPTKPLTTQQQTARREARKELSEERLRRLHGDLVRARGTGPKPPHMGIYWAASHKYHSAAIDHALKRIRAGEVHHLPVHDPETGKTSMQRVQPSHLRDMLHHGYSAIERGHTPPKGPEVPPKFSSPTPETVHHPLEPDHPDKGKDAKPSKTSTNPQASGSPGRGSGGRGRGRAANKAALADAMAHFNAMKAASG